MRGKPFEPGNKYGRGRPPGSQNRAPSKAETVLEQNCEILMKKCVYDGLQGNNASMRLCIERILPIRRARVLRFKLPSVKNIRDVGAACEAVVKGVARGQLTLAEGEAFTSMLDARRRMIETEELEARLRALEETQKKR